MPPSDPGEIVDSLQSEIGEALRVVAGYDDDGYDVFYLREDVEPKLAERADEIHGELVLQGIGRGYLEDLFAAGELHCSMHRFDEITAFHFVDEELSGLFVSVDTDANVRLSTFAETCRRHLKNG